MQSPENLELIALLVIAAFTLTGLAQADELSFSDRLAEVETAPIEYREGDEITTVRKLNGLNKYGNVTMKWGVTDSIELSDYRSLRSK